MSAIQIDEKKDPVRVILSGDISINQIENIFKEIKSLKSTQSIEVDASSVTSADVTTVQLLVLLKNKSKALHLLPGCSTEFKQTLIALGLESHFDGPIL